MNIHFIIGVIAILAGLCFLWLWTRPRFQNAWVEGIFLGLSFGSIYGGAKATSPWFKEHDGFVVVILIGLGYGLLASLFKAAVRYFEKGSKPS